MKLYIYHYLGKIGVTSDPNPCALYEFPAQFLMALRSNETAYYSGTLSALKAFLDNPRIHDILLSNESASGNAALRLAYLSVFVTGLENM